ncbi:hypothetical protein U9M48_025225 [Paspalum notatum var. saurae]
MNANKRLMTPMIILAGALLACLAFSAEAGENGGVEASTAAVAGGLRRQPEGEETAIGRSRKIVVILCVRSVCGNNPFYGPLCYCCQTLTNTPCYSNRQDCWRQCPHRQLPARRGAASVPIPSSSTSRSIGFN